MKLVGFFLAIAAIPAAAQSGLDHGHKLGTSSVYLEDAGDARDGGSLIMLSGDRIAGAIVLRADGTLGTLTPGATGSFVNSSLSKAPSLFFEAWAEQRTTDYAESGGTGVTDVQRTAGKSVMQRFVRDDLRKVYASYTVTMEKLPEEGTYRVTCGPPSGELPAQVRDKVEWKILSPAKFPVPQIMRSEDSIRLELYLNGTPANITRRVVDYIHAGGQDKMVLRKETPHDTYAEDAELEIAQPRLRVNGVELAKPVTDAPGQAATIRGPVVWIYIPGHGRYVLSPRPHPELGFQSAGEAFGNSLTFNAPDGNVFKLDTADRVAAGSGSYTVHVLPDSGWEPADPQDRSRVMIGASPGLIGPSGGGA